MYLHTFVIQHCVSMFYKMVLFIVSKQPERKRILCREAVGTMSDRFKVHEHNDL